MDVSRGEMVEAELNHLIERRHDQRRKSEGERLQEELWAESERQYQAKRQAELTLLWVSYHEQAAERALANGRAIADKHQAAIDALLGEHNGHRENGHHKGET